ncbi:Ger(x)C family spore germination protein [Pseudalkalibacillus berkeleyi]|uniref:Ger(X)C family spore germination protein n=1 Tax=Pseudalkalibacillus berkeleyi TaxID=1069813 RepID=A0ABS9H411_9BACL|nr:Ger(x)C family spore germination protein [Pseudalkalibacillus berkeleyi]MCF6138618.1 Ger(x)C family spore germination protein [Pseudalkalibacillus berkeleyi]
MTKGLIRMVYVGMCLLLLSGCVPRKSIEDVSLIQVVGYDYEGEDLIRGTAVVPYFSHLEKSEQMNEETLTTVAHSTKQIHTELSAKTSKPITIGTLKVVLYSSELASKGVGSTLESMSRDPRIGRNIFLAITEGKTEEILQAGIGKSQTTSKFITNMIDHNAKSNLPRTSLHDFLYAYYGEGIDGYTPFLKLNDNEELELDGIAFFKDGTYVYKIPFEKSFVFTLLKENFQEATQEIKFDGDYIVIESIGSKVKIIMQGDKDNPKFLIKVMMTGMINDAPTIKYQLDPPMIQKIEQTVKKYNEREAKKLIKSFQEHNIDPLGLGACLRQRVRGFNEKDWEKMYPEIPVEVEVDMKILEVGTTT